MISNSDFNCEYVLPELVKLQGWIPAFFPRTCAWLSTFHCFMLILEQQHELNRYPYEIVRCARNTLQRVVFKSDTTYSLLMPSSDVIELSKALLPIDIAYSYFTVEIFALGSNMIQNCPTWCIPPSIRQSKMHRTKWTV